MLSGSTVGFAEARACQLCPLKTEQQRGKEKKRKGGGGHRQGGRAGVGGRAEPKNRWGLLQQEGLTQLFAFQGLF